MPYPNNTQDQDDQFMAGASQGDADGSGMRPETSDFLNDLAGIGTGAFLDMRQADTPEYKDWRDGNFVADDSGNYVSQEGQTYTDDDLQQMHGLLSRQAGNPLISRLFNGPKSDLADYMTWRNQNFDNPKGGGWEDEDGNLYTEQALQGMFGAKFATGDQGKPTGLDRDMANPLEGTQLSQVGRSGAVDGNPSMSSGLAAQIPFFSTKDVPPPPSPPPPGVPPFAFDQARINKLTVEQVAGIVFNENRDVMPGSSTPEQLQEAKTAQAHAVINGDRSFGVHRQNRVGTASWQVSAKLKSSAQYQQALASARAAFQEDGIGVDPTAGRTYFNNRFEGTDLAAPRIINGQPQTPSHTYGRRPRVDSHL